MKDLKISKKLLSEVLRCDALRIEIKGNIIEYDDDFDDIVMIKNINIYEFAFKCKEWAFNKGYTILTEFFNQTCVFLYIISNEQSIEDYGHLVEDIKVLEYLFDNKTEVEAIIKACEYILKEINENR